MGLPLCNDIMQAHGGTLMDKFSEGKGSVFYAEPPYARPEALVIDDEPLARKLIAGILKDIGANISTAGGGEEAFELMKQTSPHLILLDLYMEPMDGFVFPEKIEANHKLAASL